MIRRSKSRRTRKRSMRGGNVSLKFNKPEVNATSSSDAIQGAMNKQKVQNEEVVEMNKAMAGGGKGVVVPQMAQAGEEGNESISGTIGSTLQGRADGEYDNDVYKGGRRKRSRKGGKNSPQIKVSGENPCDTQLDRCLREIILDPDPNNQAAALATIEQAETLVKEGKSIDEVMSILQSTPRREQAEGGLSYLMGM